MKTVCPSCEREVDLKRVQATKTTVVRGENVEHEDHFFECPSCGDRSWTSELPDPTFMAFVEYRKRHGLLQPQDIHGFRKRLGLTQHELGAIIGVSYVTLSRYERGGLQDDKHDRLLRDAMEDAEWFLERLRAVASQLPKAKVEQLEEASKAKLRSALRSTTPWTVWELDPPSVYNGYRSFQSDKYIHSVLAFCSAGVPRTKLNKLLFYQNFAMYKQHATSVAGVAFVREQFGPVVADHYSGVDALLRDGYLKIVVETVGQNEFENLVSAVAPDLSVFSPEELKILQAVEKKFGKTTAKGISDISHEEKAWIEVEQGRRIPYSFASDLKAL